MNRRSRFSTSIGCWAAIPPDSGATGPDPRGPPAAMPGAGGPPGEVLLVPQEVREELGLTTGHHRVEVVGQLAAPDHVVVDVLEVVIRLQRFPVLRPIDDHVAPRPDLFPLDLVPVVDRPPVRGGL